MLRFMFRVVVVASVVLSLTVFAVPTVQAGSGKANVSATKAEPSLLPAALAWLGNLINGQAPKKPKSITARSATNGPCIDPMGRERPCW
jgi:hypothetical protein